MEENTMRIIRTANYEEMSQQAANIIASQIILKPDCILGLATGSTPEGLYANLVEKNKCGDIDFSKVTTVNLDEYVGLSTDHEQSYRYFMNHNLFNHVNIDATRTFLPNGMAEDIDAECKRYDAMLAQLGGADIQLLGIGHNGHVAFNEPDDAFEPATHKVALSQSTIEANSRFFDSMDAVPKFAVTMGIGGIMSAKTLLLVASGKDKAEAVKAAVTGPVTPQVPASILQFHPNAIIVADEDALSLL